MIPWTLMKAADLFDADIKDGRWVFLYHEDFMTPGIVGRWDEGRGAWIDDLGKLLRREPTHFALLNRPRSNRL